MDNAKHGCERDFIEQTALDGFPDLRREMCQALQKNVGSLVEKEMSSKEYDSVVVEVGELSLRPEALPSADLKALRDFVRNGNIPEDMIESLDGVMGLTAEQRAQLEAALE